MNSKLRAACEQCRTAKLKVCRLAQDADKVSSTDCRLPQCDRERPACGRCAQRGIECNGLSNNAGFLFLNENDIARRNSQRARGEGGTTINISIDFTINQTENPEPGEQHQILTPDERAHE